MNENVQRFKKIIKYNLGINLTEDHKNFNIESKMKNISQEKLKFLENLYKKLNKKYPQLVRGINYNFDKFSKDFCKDFDNIYEFDNNNFKKSYRKVENIFVNSYNIGSKSLIIQENSKYNILNNKTISDESFNKSILPKIKTVEDKKNLLEKNKKDQVISIKIKDNSLEKNNHEHNKIKLHIPKKDKSLDLNQNNIKKIDGNDIIPKNEQSFYYVNTEINVTNNLSKSEKLNNIKKNIKENKENIVLDNLKFKKINNSIIKVNNQVQISNDEKNLQKSQGIFVSRINTPKNFNRFRLRDKAKLCNEDEVSKSYKPLEKANSKKKMCINNYKNNINNTNIESFNENNNHNIQNQILKENQNKNNLLSYNNLDHQTKIKNNHSRIDDYKKFNKSPNLIKLSKTPTVNKLKNQNFGELNCLSNFWNIDAKFLFNNPSNKLVLQIKKKQEEDPWAKIIKTDTDLYEKEEKEKKMNMKLNKLDFYNKLKSQIKDKEIFNKALDDQYYSKENLKKISDEEELFKIKQAEQERKNLEARKEINKINEGINFFNYSKNLIYYLFFICRECI